MIKIKKQSILNLSILSLMLIVLSRSQGQTYKPLLNDFNEWHITICSNGCSTYRYYTDGDTIVNGQNYSILDGYHFISRSFLLREDVLNQKIYLKFLGPGIHPNEYLLYDFSLQEGETINMKNPISPFPTDAGDFTVDSIRLKPLVDGNNYRHFYLSPNDETQAGSTGAVWVEGVGSLNLINAPGGWPNHNESGQLSCFFKESELFYADYDSINACIPVAPLELPSINNNKFKLYPNPITDRCIIESGKKMAAISVQTLDNKTLISKSFEPINKIDFDLINIPSGLYLVMITFEDGSKIYRKVIKQ